MTKINLYLLSETAKYDYLNKVIYEHIDCLPSGRLVISDFYCKKTAELLGGDFTKLSKNQKKIFKSNIFTEKINPMAKFDYYI